MARRREKLNRAAHIKRYTEGTSNEISFSVLDAAKNAQLGDREPLPPLVGVVELFTMSGRRARGKRTYQGDTPFPVGTTKGRSRTGTGSRSRSAGTWRSRAGDGALSAADEVARRKRRRRVRNAVAVAVVVGLSAIIVASGGGLLYQEQQKELNQTAQLDAAIALVAGTDGTMVAIDDVVADPLSTDVAAARQTALETADATTGQLDQADAIAREVSVTVRGNQEKEAANQTVAAVAARRTMLESGMQVVRLSASAAEATGLLERAWDSIMQADSAARDAARLAEGADTSVFEESLTKTNEALLNVQDAAYLVSQAQAAYPDANLEAFTAYLAKRQEALGYALASDQAMVNRDIDEAQAQNDAYNLADTEAAQLAERLPDSPGEPVKAAFDKAAADPIARYNTARAQAGSADAFIRDYLGKQGE